MAFLIASFLLLCSYCSASEYSHLTGHFGDVNIHVDITFGDANMKVTVHKPETASVYFRTTSNLHVFPTHTVAIRNSQDKECYIQRFNTTMNEMKERADYATHHNGQLGAIKEERIFLEGLKPLLQRSVSRILGPEIADFCHEHKVYIIPRKHYYLLQPHGRGKRYVIDDPQSRTGDIWDGGDSGGNGGGTLKDRIIGRVC